MDKSFINEINNRIARQELTIANLAKKIGVNNSTLSKYLKHQRKMPLIVALDLAKALDIDISAECGLRTEQISDIEKEIITSLRRIPVERRIEASMAICGIINVIIKS